MLCVLSFSSESLNNIIIIGHLHNLHKGQTIRKIERSRCYSWCGGQRRFFVSLVQYFDPRISSEMLQPLVSSEKLA